MRITDLPQYRRHARRLTEGLRVLVKYGLAEWVGERAPELLEGLLKSGTGEALAGRPRNERIRMAMAELGTTYVKLGQILSTRADIVGPELAAELSRLQSDTPPDTPEVVRRTAEQELGAPLEELFAEFEPEALASASIGQVHRARLHDGSEVVVKIQHAGIQKQVEADLEMLQSTAAYLEEHHPTTRRFQPRALAAEFRRTLLSELDYGLELRNAQRFLRNFEDDPRVRFAGVFPERSSRRVLTMDFLQGTSVAQTERLAQTGIDLRDLAWRGANVYLEMIFRDGLYHADPHPGNIFVLDDGMLALLDCGMVGRIDSGLREKLEGLLIAVTDRNAADLVRGILTISKVPARLDRELLSDDVTSFLDLYSDSALGDFDLSGALNDLLGIVRRHHLVLTPHIAMLIKVLVMLEGTARQLDPRFSLADLLQPWYGKAIARRLDPRRALRRARSTYRDWEQLLRELPGRGSEILARVQDGSFDIHLEHRHLDTAVNRAVLGLLTAALLVASAMMWAGDVGPLIGGASMLGVAGYALSGWFGWRLLRAIRASGDLRSRD